MKSWGPLSRHETAEGGRGPARPARRMPGLSSDQAHGRMSESSTEIPRSSPIPAGHPGELLLTASPGAWSWTGDGFVSELRCNDGNSGERRGRWHIAKWHQALLNGSLKMEYLDMPLIAIDTFRGLLACPRCCSPLTGSIASLACSLESCGREYPAIGEPSKPVLIDSETSIVDVTALVESHGASLIVRGNNGRLKEFVLRRTETRNTTAEHYARRLVEDLIAETDGRPRLLVIGGGVIGSGVEVLYKCRNIDLLAFDVYNSDNCQFLADGHHIPLKNKSIDGVVIQAVLSMS